MARVVIVFLFVIASVGCGRVPVEVKTAMEKQAAELRQIKASQKDGVNLLFAQIRVLQLYILNEKEKEFQQQYARGARVVKLQDGSDAVVYNDATGKPLPPSGNVNTDLIAISTSRLISDWFAKKRAETEQRLLQTKEEFLKLQGHIEITEQINQAVTEYLDSLINLRSKQKELGDNLVKRVATIPGVASIQNSLISLLVRDTKELEAQMPK